MVHLNESSREAVTGEASDPDGKGRRREAHGNQKEEQDKGARDLGPV